jgi:hypothetical protein
MTESEKTGIEKPQEIVANEGQQKDARVEFEQRFDFFMTQFRTVCEDADAPLAIAIVVDAKNPTTPFVYSHGPIYDQALILTKILRELKNKIFKELSA